MNLPNYFLADLPPEATLSQAMISDACQTLKRNRQQYLAGRTTASLTRLLSSLADNWLQADYPFRQFALEQGPKATGFSAATIASGLDSLFKQWTPERFQSLLTQELGHAQRLDTVCSTTAEQKSLRAAMARGPEFIAHIAGGVIPNGLITSLALGFVARSAQFAKCATGTSFLPRLFAHSIYDADPKLGACLEIAEWRGGTAHLEDALFAEADCITASGNDETLAKIRHKAPLHARFLAHGHRVSFAFIAQEVLGGFSVKKIVARAASDVAAWNQLGCLSPHVIYVENGGGVAVEQFAEMLAAELDRIEQTEPRGELKPESAAVIASKRGFYEIRAAHSPDTRHWSSPNSTAWTVIYEADPRFQLSCLNRFIYVKGVTSLTDALQGADSVRGTVSTVGIAATDDRAAELAAQLGIWGVPRVCPLGQMQCPPLTWRHDGRPSLGDLVTWTDWEQ